MAIAHIKGPSNDGIDDGLDDLIRRQTARKPEDRKAIEVIGERKFGELWVKYERALNSVDSLKVDIIEYYVDRAIDDVLTPSQIEEFFRLTIAYENNKHYQKCTKLIINELIQNSYNADNNGFVLNTNELAKPIDDLCANLRGTHNKPINITINGDVGYYFCSQGKFLSVTINGNTRDICNDYGSSSSFIINGNAKSIAGSSCSFIVNGDVEIINIDFDIKSSSSYTINGEVKDQEFSVYSTRCVFKTQNQKTLGVFLRRIPLFRGHTIYFISEDGSESKVGMWDRFVKRMAYKLKE